MACGGGHLDMVIFFLSNQTNLLTLEEQEDGFSTSLHVAASGGYTDIVRQLLRVCPRLARYRDSEGRTPLHRATVKGREPIIEEILSMDMESAQLLTRNKESVLHLSVKSNQYETVKSLLKRPEINNLVNLPDNDGNTAFHLAAMRKLSPIIKLLLSKTCVDVSNVNKGGLAALDILRNDPGDIDDKEIVKLLKHNSSSGFSGRSFKSRRYKNEERETTRYMLNVLVVVATLIASVTFQAGLNPPGGYWQDWNTASNSTGMNSNVTVNSTVNNSDDHRPGKSISAQLIRSDFNAFMYSNSVAFFLSSMIIYFHVVNLKGITPMKKLTVTKLVLTAATLEWCLLSYMEGL